MANLNEKWRQSTGLMWDVDKMIKEVRDKDEKTRQALFDKLCYQIGLLLSTGPRRQGRFDYSSNHESDLVDDLRGQILKYHIADEKEIAYAMDKGYELQLCKDFALETNGIVFNDERSIDLNGFALTSGEYGFTPDGDDYPGQHTHSIVIWAKPKADVLVMGKGDVYVKPSLNEHAIYAEGGTVTVTDGTYHPGGTTNQPTVYALGGGKVIIRGGVFYGNPNKEYKEGKSDKNFVLGVREWDYNSGHSDIKVYGGTFHGFNPAKNFAQGPDTNFLGEGVESVEIEKDVWEVRPASPRPAEKKEDKKEDKTAPVKTAKRVVEEDRTPAKPVKQPSSEMPSMMM